MHRQIHLTSSREIFDVTVPTMLRTTWNGTCTFLPNFGLDILARTTRVDRLWFRWLSNNPLKVSGGDEFRFALVPLFEDLLGWCAAKDTGMDESGEADAGDVARGAEYALEVPDCFRSEDGSV